MNQYPNMTPEQVMTAKMYLMSKGAKTLPRKVGGGDSYDPKEREASARKVYDLLKSSGDALTAVQIKDGLGRHYETVKRWIDHAIRIGLIEAKPINARMSAYSARVTDS